MIFNIAAHNRDDNVKNFAFLMNDAGEWTLSPAYDLVFRHALAVDQSGNTLAMGSTTGGLWISEDAGMNWKEVNLRLPPVHAVRWV